jgi:hypothetical protein
MTRSALWILAAILAAGFVVSLLTGETMSFFGEAKIVKRSEQPLNYWWLMLFLAAGSVTAALGQDWLFNAHGN